MLKNKRAVIFDLDGTMVDSMWVWADIDIKYLGALGFEVPADMKRAIEGMSFTEVAVYFKEKFHIKETIDEIKEIWQQMAMDRYKNEVEVKSGLKEFMAYLKEHDFRMGVASSNDITLIEAVLESHDVWKYLDCVVTSCEVKKGKPEPDVYLEAARRLGVEPADCLVFEDIVSGIQAGLNAGMQVCAVRDVDSMYQDEEKRQLAHYYIESYQQVLDGTYENLKIQIMKMFV